MKRLIIVGAGGYGREMCASASGSVGFGTDFEVKGFLDDRSEALSGFSGYPPVLGSPHGYEPQADDVFIVALGDLRRRRACAELVAARGGKFLSLVHRTAFVGPNVVLGEGVFVAPLAVLTADISLGAHTAVFHHACIGHDTVVGAFSHVYAQCSIGGSVAIGDGVSVYPGAVVLPRRKIGDGAVVGAHSTVVLNVPPSATVFGSPAAPVR